MPASAEEAAAAAAAAFSFLRFRRSRLRAWRSAWLLVEEVVVE